MSANLVCCLIFFACALAVHWAWRKLTPVLLCVLCALCGSTMAQPPQVDMAEIKRLGDHVQYVDGNAAASAGDYVEVMGPPADDNHKWFISIVGAKGCAACARLKADLKTDEYLRALITVHENDDNHSDTRTSWAHYTYYLAGDKSQDFRWEKLKITGYPTIIVQPPLNKKYGDPATVVCQITGYDGDGKKLATNIAAAIKAYLAKQAQVRVQGSGVRGQGSGKYEAAIYSRRPLRPRVNARGASLKPQASGLRSQAWAQPDDIGLDPPWAPAPKVEPVPSPTPEPRPLNPGPVLPPIFDWPPKPLPSPTPDPRPLNPDASIPSSPEAVIVCDTTVLSREDEARIRPVVERLRKERPGLRVRIADLRDAKNLPVQQTELPAVVVTSDGKVDEKITARLFPLFQPAEPVPANAAVNVTVPPIPWQETATAVATGNIPAIVAAVVGWIIWIRARRKAAGQAVIAPSIPLEQLAPVLTQIGTTIATAIVEAMRPKQP